MKIEDLARKWIQTKYSTESSLVGAITNPERELDYIEGIREGLRLAIRLLKQLRPEMGGLGGPIYILKEWLDGKADIPEEVSE